MPEDTKPKPPMPGPFKKAPGTPVHVRAVEQFPVLFPAPVLDQLDGLPPFDRRAYKMRQHEIITKHLEETGQRGFATVIDRSGPRLIKVEAMVPPVPPVVEPKDSPVAPRAQKEVNLSTAL